MNVFYIIMSGVKAINGLVFDYVTNIMSSKKTKTDFKNFKRIKVMKKMVESTLISAAIMRQFVVFLC